MNPFKVGDKVKAASSLDGVHFPAGAVYTVLSVGTLLVTLDSPHPRAWYHGNLVAAIAGVDYPHTQRSDNLPLRSDAGKWMGHGGSVRPELGDMPGLFYSKDCGGSRGVSINLHNIPKEASWPTDVVRTDPEPMSGHLSDGSSVQKHSAGGLYPVVVWHRDKVLPGKGKYDVGITWPDQPEPVWLRDYDTAVSVAEAIKENLK